MRKYGRQDANHGIIRSAFERLGCSVCDLSALGDGRPDLLIGFGGLCIAVEVKNPDQPKSKRKLKPDQEKWHMTWTGGYKIVEDLAGVEETVALLQDWHAAIKLGVTLDRVKAASPHVVLNPVGTDYDLVLSRDLKD